MSWFFRLQNIRILQRSFPRILIIYAYIPLSIVYSEILLRLLCGYSFLSWLHYALLVSIAAGAAVNAVSLALPGKNISRYATCTLLGINCFVFTFSYFMYSIYKSFVYFGSIFHGAGNIIDGFAGTVISVIISGIPVIIAFFLPFIIFLLLTRKHFPFTAGEKKARIITVSILAAISMVSISAGAIILHTSGKDKASFYSEYNFDSSSRQLGILTGLGLEIRYKIFGNHYKYEALLAKSLLDEEEPPGEEPEPEYGYNVMEIDFDAIIAREKDARIKAINAYVAGIEKSRENKYTGLFRDKNLIIITAESFTKELLDTGLTPTLSRLIHNGFFFSDYYQPNWDLTTIGGEFAILSGIAPTYGLWVAEKSIGKNMSFMIGNKLRNLGFFTASWHNGMYNFYNRDKIHTNFGYNTFVALDNGIEKGIKWVWPASDHEMMQYTLPQYIDKQPFSVYYMTVSGHFPYRRGGNAMTRKNWDTITGLRDIPGEDLSDPVRSYLACNLELEYAMEYLVSTLEAAGIADDTVIVLSSDHYPYGLQSSELTGFDKDNLDELFGFEVRTLAEKDRNALIIWSGCLEKDYKKLAVEVSSPTCAVDILPTLCNLFGLEYDSRLLAGRDVFSDTMPLAFWPNRSWKTDMGYYADGIFTPSTNDAIPEGYVNRIRNIVNGKITYCEEVIVLDYFNVIFNHDGTLRDTDQ
ncbi:MAG: sulfatase-like hydrolase/transferase [Treponema sp.]|nr:sulfatase-like hydrolase/transferase [Treponema sp.]